MNAPRTRGRTWSSAATVSSAGSSASSAVRSSVSVEAGSRDRPPRSCSRSSRVLTRLPLWPMAIERLRPLAVRGLGVLPDRGARGRVAAMGDGQRAAQARQMPLVEHRADHPEVLVEHQLLAVADGHAGRLLPAMLEREQAEGRDRGRLGGLGARSDRAEDAAHPLSPPSRGRGPGRGPRRGAGRRSGPRGRRRCGSPAPRWHPWRRHRSARS